MTPSLIDRSENIQNTLVYLVEHQRNSFFLFHRRGVVTEEYRIEMQPPDQFRYNNAGHTSVTHQPISCHDQIHESKLYENEVNTFKQLNVMKVTILYYFHCFVPSWISI